MKMSIQGMSQEERLEGQSTYCNRLVIEVLSDVRDPLDELQSAEVQLAREESEKRFESLVDQIEALEARLPRSKKSERESIKKVLHAWLYY
jgi:hypothetical protein